MRKSFILPLILSALFIGCGGHSAEEHALWLQAEELQKQAKEINKTATADLREALNTGSSNTMDRLKSLKGRLGKWNSDLRLVAVEEHEHSPDGKCNHDHSAQSIDLLIEDRVYIMQELLDSIKVISIDLQAATRLAEQPSPLNGETVEAQ